MLGPSGPLRPPGRSEFGLWAVPWDGRRRPLIVALGALQALVAFLGLDAEGGDGTGFQARRPIGSLVSSQ